MRCGIDFSINSPGICIERNDNLFFWGGVRDDANLRKIDKAFLERFKSIPNCNIFNLPKKVTGIDYSEQETLNLLDAETCVNIVLNILKNNIDKSFEIGIEGFSYQSKGAQTDKIYGYGYILRWVLHQEGYKFKIVSPKSIKMKAGKGNYNKEQMIEAFLENKLQDTKLNFLKEAIILNKAAFRDTKKYLKPIEDVVDAYFLTKC